MTAKRIYQSPLQQARRRRILAVARALLSEHGYDGLTMRLLAQRAEVAKKTLYNLYRSKDELVLAALQDVLAKIERRVNRHSTADGIARILQRTKETAMQVQRTPKYARAMARALYQSKPNDFLVHALLQQNRQQTIVQLNMAQSRAELPAATDCDALAGLMLAQSWGVILLWSKGLIPTNRVVQCSLDGQSTLLRGAGVMPGLIHYQELANGHA